MPLGEMDSAHHAMTQNERHVVAIPNWCHEKPETADAATFSTSVATRERDKGVT